MMRDRDRVPRATARKLMGRAMKAGLWFGIPLLLLPIVLPRKVAAKRPANAASKPFADPAGADLSAVASAKAERTLQDLIDECRAALDIPQPVLARLVPVNALVVSVERDKDREGTFVLSLESGFVDGLSGDDLRAIVAHELGHVWIFTHHPFLQTEEQANEIALTLVSRDALERVYDKVWKRTGTKGTLQYLPVE